MSASGASPSSRGSGTGSVSATGHQERDYDRDFDRDRSVGSQHLSTRPRRETTETKAAFKTTEFIAYLGVLAGLLLAGLIVDDAGEGGFGAQEVWRYVTFLTVGYMVSRGLAKAGSRDPYDADGGGGRNS